MRSITVLVIACCVLAASCFPKHNHVDKKVSKLIQDAENDLDQASDNELVNENDQEENGSDNEEPALNEAEKVDEDNEPALEDAEAEKVEESDAEPKLEESDNAEAEDNNVQLEEDEERNVAQKNVASDIEKLQQALEESDISSKARDEASANLHKIQADVSEMRHASAERRSNLKEAVHKRIQAFRLMVETSENKRNNLEEEEEKIVTRVKGDVSQLEEAVESSSLSKSEKHRAEKNLEAIARDAEEYSHAGNTKAKQLFREAIAKRMQALHMMLEADTGAKVDTTAVVSDIHHIQSELKHTKMAAKAKKAVKENLSHMLKDAEEIPAATGERRGRLEQAMKLRSKALHQQLEQY